MVGLAVVAVLSRLGELAGHLLARSVQVVLVGQRVSVDAALQSAQQQFSNSAALGTYKSSHEPVLISTYAALHNRAEPWGSRSVGVCMPVMRSNCCKSRLGTNPQGSRGTAIAAYDEQCKRMSSRCTNPMQISLKDNELINKALQVTSKLKNTSQHGMSSMSSRTAAKLNIAGSARLATARHATATNDKRQQENSGLPHADHNGTRLPSELRQLHVYALACCCSMHFK